MLSVSAGKIGNVIYDSTGSFTSSSIAGKWIKLHASSINQAYYVAQRYCDNAIRVSKRYNTSTSALDPSSFAGIAETGWADANGYQIFADRVNKSKKDLISMLKSIKLAQTKSQNNVYKIKRKINQRLEAFRKNV